MSTETPAERLGRYVLHRREKELDWNQDDVADAGGPSDSWQTVIENGRLKDLSRSTARKLDTALGWERGSARRVWDGGEPFPLLPGVKPKESAMWRRIIEESDLDEERRRALVAELERVLETG